MGTVKSSVLQLRMAVLWKWSRMVPATLGLALALVGCSNGGGNSGGPGATSVVYTESNEPAANTILAFRRASDGALTPLSGSPFDLRGAGLANPTESLGPPDKDTPIVT